MKYDDALKAWGAIRLEREHRHGYGGHIDRSTVDVQMNFSEGNPCCGGTNPDCYCSMAESPRAEVVITGRNRSGWRYTTTISLEDFDFTKILGEIVNATSDNTITP